MQAPDRRPFRLNDSGAVAASYALALPALIAVAAYGMDYARMAGMDSELQNGADQAALAGASQLNKKSGACSRAANAAVSLVANESLLGSGANAVTIPLETSCDAVGQVRFYQDKAKATPATSDANARFIEVQVNAKTVDYALFPVIGLVSSGNMDAAAFAGLGSAICKQPPVMMCNPNETADPNFTTPNYVGTGIRLIANDGGGTYGQGVFGYIETDAGSGANVTKELIGREEVPGECVSADEGADMRPGLSVTVMDYLNTRFDIYANGLSPACTEATCPPSANAKTDLLKGPGTQCSIGNGNGTNGWRVPVAPYRPTSAVNPLTAAEAAALSPMGYPRDICHAVSVTGSCIRDKIGDGNWDRNAYFTSNTANWPTVPNYSSTFGTTTPTRYQVYRHEYANAKLASQTDVSGPLVARSAPICGAPGVPPNGTQIDRRVLSVAVINCTAENVGSSTTDATIQKFVDVFLVEPSTNRGNGGSQVTEKSDVYVEVIGETTLGGGSNAGQNIRKDVPYLVE
ncbi:TadE/TadG family type IV pilus assembly protein [Altererythrobacter sp. ZODW24]|uniref:TadE/TadG family type IV pilus assembly protein n=1 Tax=Altererythrobacter sp. ZODW24 TaxID=2185142 RepID=UPI000DF84BCA|nr:TadE/TadG family type IV pilus assembly protein [Altererythrobacter sp. ZODW24]